MTGVVHWSSQAFEDELRAWVEGVLGPVRLERHKLRPWSTVWKAYAGDGLFWAKQNCRANTFEAALAEALAQWLPERFVPVVATDHERGFLLTPDQGDVLGFDHVELATWCRIVREWAAVQRELVDRVDDLAALGVPAQSPADVVAELPGRAATMHALGPDDVRGLTDDQRRAVDAALPAVRRSAARVQELGLPLTLNHNDLHGGNVFRRQDRVFDLGDALLTEPMGALLVPLERIAEGQGLAPNDRGLHQVADAWVEVWSDVAPATDLRAVLPDALRLARFARHQSWWRVSEDLTLEELDRFGAFGAEALATVATEPPLSEVSG